MFLLVLAYPGCPGQSPESCKMVVVIVVYILNETHDMLPGTQSESFKSF